MWPFKKKQPASTVMPEQVSFSQLDITEHFNDNLTLGPDEWITTSPLDNTPPDSQSMGLPPVGAGEDEVYRIAEKLSRLRESIPIPDDGVYCPICHIANVSLARLRTPCPQCGRALLKFGWD